MNIYYIYRGKSNLKIMEIANQQIEKVKVSYQEYNEFPMYSIYLIMKYVDAIGGNVGTKEQEINGGFDNTEMDISI